MAVQEFNAQVEGRAGFAVIYLSGEIDSFAQAGLQAVYSEAERQGTAVIVLDFSRVHYINSTGIALLVGLLRRARQTGRRLSVCGLSDHYQEIFQITRLVDYLDIYPDLDQALAQAH